MFGLFQLYDHQIDAFSLGSSCGFFSSVTLVNKRHFNTFSGGLLNFVRQVRHLGELIGKFVCGS